MEAAKTFFSPRGIFIVCVGIAYISFMGINSMLFYERWNYWTHEYDKALLYYQQPVCQDSQIKSRTEGVNTCDKMSVFLMSYPWTRALTDVFEANYICSSGGCTAWFRQLILLFAFLTLLLIYLFFTHTAWTLDKIERINTVLPIIGSSAKSKKLF